MTLNLATYLFFAGAGAVMTTSLWWWQRSMNGNRRVPHWIITVQMLGWNLYLIRSSFFLFAVQRRGPSWWLVLAVGLMTAGQAGHLWSILRRTHYEARKENRDGTESV